VLSISQKTGVAGEYVSMTRCRAGPGVELDPWAAVYTRLTPTPFTLFIHFIYSLRAKLHSSLGSFPDIFFVRYLKEVQLVLCLSFSCDEFSIAKEYLFHRTSVPILRRFRHRWKLLSLFCLWPWASSSWYVHVLYTFNFEMPLFGFPGTLRHAGISMHPRLLLWQ